jgi:hypothetical protein
MSKYEKITNENQNSMRYIHRQVGSGFSELTANIHYTRFGVVDNVQTILFHDKAYLDSFFLPASAVSTLVAVLIAISRIRGRFNRSPKRIEDGNQGDEQSHSNK